MNARDAALALAPSDSSVPYFSINLLAPILGGGTPTSDGRHWDGDVAFVTPPDLNGLDGKPVESWGRTITDLGARTGSTKIDAGVLISCRAPIGHVGTALSSVAFNQGCKGLPVVDRTDARYLAYCLVAGREALNVLGNGTTFTELSSRALGGFKVPWPTSERRACIADYLDRETAEIDAMDAELDRLVENLRERQQALLLDLGHRLAAEGERTRIGYLLVKQARSVEGREGVITAFRGGQVTLRANRREDGFTMSRAEAGYQGVEPGDFVFHGLDGFAGAVGVSDSHGKASPVYHVCTTSERTFPEFMAWALRAMAASGLLEAFAWSVRQRSVDYRNWNTFASLPITHIDVEEQRRIVRELDEQTARIGEMIADAQRLKALLAERRSTLITEVVTGKKEVPA